MSSPSMRMVPELCSRTPRIMLMVVVFPAPFGPRRPTISLCPTSKEMSSTAAISPYNRRRRRTASTFSRPMAVSPSVTNTRRDVSPLYRTGRSNSHGSSHIPPEIRTTVPGGETGRARSSTARLPVPRQLDVPFPLDRLPAGGSTGPDRSFPVPDGGSQFLVRNAGDDVQFQAFGRNPEPPAGGIPRAAFRAPPVLEDLDPHVVGGERPEGAVREDQRAGAERIGAPVRAAEPVEHQVLPVRQLQGEPVPAGLSLFEGTGPPLAVQPGVPLHRKRGIFHPHVPAGRQAGHRVIVRCVPRGGALPAEPPVSLQDDQPRGVEYEVDRRSPFRCAQPDRRGGGDR